jgi:hypothetical protein
MTGEKKKADDEVCFIPEVSFTGYPDGKTKTKFTAGTKSAPVPADYLELLREKGLVRRAVSS